MNRREFSRLAMLAALSQTQVRLNAQPKPAERVHFSVMLWTLERTASFDRCLDVVAQAGYQGVELVGEFQHWSPEERARIQGRLRSLGLLVDAMSGVKAGFAVPEDNDAFRTQFAGHLRSAKELACDRVILLSGNRVQGAAPDLQRQNSIDNLTWAAEQAERYHIEVLIEPIDLLENPAVYLSTVTDAFDLARTVGAANLRVLYDVYHEQRSYGNLLEKLENNLDLVGLIHIADVPGRHEPGTGEIAYDAIYGLLGRLGYKRWIAMEFYPTSDPVASLRKAKVDALHAMGV